MFNDMSNVVCNNILFSPSTLGNMDKTMERLYVAARVLKQIEGQSAVASAMGETPQTVNNWESRGMSQRGMMRAQEVFGCSPTWLKSEQGPMKVGDSQELARPPVIEDHEWNALSMTQREFIEMLSLTPLNDMTINALKGMLAFLEQTPQATHAETSKITDVSPSASVVNTIKPLRRKRQTNVHTRKTKQEKLQR